MLYYIFFLSRRLIPILLIELNLFLSLVHSKSLRIIFPYIKTCLLLYIIFIIIILTTD